MTTDNGANYVAAFVRHGTGGGRIGARAATAKGQEQGSEHRPKLFLSPEERETEEVEVDEDVLEPEVVSVHDALVTAEQLYARRELALPARLPPHLRCMYVNRAES